MSRPANRIDFPPALRSRKAFDLGPEQRGRIGRAAFGDKQGKLTEEQQQKLTADFWEEVLTATSYFTIMDVAKDKPSAANVRKRLARFTESAESLREEVTGVSEETSAFSIQAIHEAFFKDPTNCTKGLAALFSREREVRAALQSNELNVRLNAIHIRYFRDLTPGEPFGYLVDVLDGAIALAKCVEKSMDRQTGGGLSEDAMWDEWIIDLTEIVKKYGLPHKVRTDTDKGAIDRPSKFVLFVYALQKELPEPHQRHQQSHASLASAINNARRKFRFK